MFKNVNSLEFLDHIWNHHEKYIRKSTNLPGIGSITREIDNFRYLRKQIYFLLSKTNARVLKC